MNDDGYECRFICRGCGEHTFRCRYRGEFEDIVQWIETAVKPGMTVAHIVQSPECLEFSADLKFKIEPGSKGVGRRVQQ